MLLAWFVRSQATPYSERMLGRLAREAAHVPLVWSLEFANALRQLERRRRLKPESTNEILDGVGRLGLVSDASPPDQRRLIDLARHYDLSIYDASYLELAIRLTLPVAAQDGPLAAAAVKAGLKAE